MTPEPATTKSPSLSSQVSRAVLWNVLFVPIRMLAEIFQTLVKLTVLPPISYGVLSLISATNNGLGTWIDLGTGRALPKFIPESNGRGGRRAVTRLLLVALGAQMALLLVIGGALLLLRNRYFAYLRNLVNDAINVPASDQQRLLSFIQQSGGVLIGTILAVLLFGIFYDVLMAYLSSFFRQRAWNSITLAAQLMPPLFTAAVILAGWDIAGVVAVMVFAPAVATALVGWQVLRHQRQLAPTPADADDGNWLPPGFVRYCSVSFLMTATDYLASAGFAAFFASDAVEIAVLMAGVNIVKVVLSYLYTPMVGVQVPLFTRVRAGEGGTLNGAYQSLVRLQVLLLVPGGVGLVLLARPIFALLQSKYIEAAPLVWILVPLPVSGVAADHCAQRPDRVRKTARDRDLAAADLGLRAAGGAAVSFAWRRGRGLGVWLSARAGGHLGHRKWIPPAWVALALAVQRARCAGKRRYGDRVGHAGLVGAFAQRQRIEHRATYGIARIAGNQRDRWWGVSRSAAAAWRDRPTGSAPAKPAENTGQALDSACSVDLPRSIYR